MTNTSEWKKEEFVKGGGYVHSREAASEGFVRWRKLASADDLLGSCCCLGSFLISNVLGSSPHFFWFLTHRSYSFLHLLNRTYPHFLQLHLPKKKSVSSSTQHFEFQKLAHCQQTILLSLCQENPLMILVRQSLFLNYLGLLQFSLRLWFLQNLPCKNFCLLVIVSEQWIYWKSD